MIIFRSFPVVLQENAFGHSKIGKGEGDLQFFHKYINFKISSQRCFLSGHFLFTDKEMRASGRASVIRVFRFLIKPVVFFYIKKTRKGMKGL